MAKVTVKDTEITVVKIKDEDYLCLTDMLKAKDGDYCSEEDILILWDG